MEPRHVNPEVPLKGHWKAIKDEKENNVTLDLWLEEEGFFRLKFEEVSKEQKGNFTSNEESGHYSYFYKFFFFKRYFNIYFKLLLGVQRMELK